MNIAQAKCIPIGAYLERQGLTPQKSRQGGQELWYHSPIRDGDENPSFKVDTIKNLWFDHGAERWSRDFGPVVKVDRLMRETIQDEEAKEPFCGFQGTCCH